MWSPSSRDMFELSGREKSVLPLLTLECMLFSEGVLTSGQKHHSGQLQKHCKGNKRVIFLAGN